MVEHFVRGPPSQHTTALMAEPPPQRWTGLVAGAQNHLVLAGCRRRNARGTGDSGDEKGESFVDDAGATFSDPKHRTLSAIAPSAIRRDNKKTKTLGLAEVR